MPVALVARVVDSQANQTFDATFERFPVRIGRNQINDLHIDRPYVSQFHAAIDLRGSQIFVKDLGSTNGTVIAGKRLARDVPVEITQTPDITIGPIVIRLGIVEAVKRRDEGTVLELGEHGSMSGVLARPKPIQPGAEDPYVRQVVPYIEAYRTAWGGVYRVIYDHLARMPAELRASYVTRLGLEHPAVSAESDFQRIAQYYGVDSRTFMELSPPQAALAALVEIGRALAPGIKSLDDVGSVLSFARKIRDAMEVFLKSFVSLRDGYQEFQYGVIQVDRSAETDRVATAKDAKELGLILLSPTSDPEAVHQVHEILVDVMSHQVALITGVMAAVKKLLGELSPKAVEDEVEKKGKKGRLFGKNYEELWKQYEIRHDDFAGDEKNLQDFLFGRQFARAYDEAAGEDNKAPEGALRGPRPTMSANQLKQR
jgi:type VI secretion system protein ImpI